VELVGRKLTGNNLHLYINPERDSHEEALRVHGITTEFLRDKPKFAEVAQQILEYIRGAELIIHNAPFDVGFLNAEFARLKLGTVADHAANVIDTLVMAKQLFPGKRNSLDALCDRLEVDNSGRTLHGALLDAELLADVYINMTRGQEALLLGAEDDASGGPAQQIVRVDLRQFTLPVLHANEAELAAHAQVLARIDKDSGNKTIWKNFESLA
jgi:DNA polymerase-3 subunit epsilon